jgi:hypothetical protein
MGERQRVGLMRSSTEGSIAPEVRFEADDGVGAMVAGVKSRGVCAVISISTPNSNHAFQGKELLKYVKSLLG